MATTKKKEQELITLDGVRTRTVTLHLVGTETLILCKKSKSFENEQIFLQSHPKGTPMPDKLNEKLHYNLWEKLITSIDWEKPAPDHDNYEDYTQEEYLNLMETNRPCIASKAFIGSIAEAFISFGFKESTKKNGTDITRCLKVMGHKVPVNFTGYGYNQHLVPNNSKDHANVLCQQNEFYGWSCDLTLSFIEVTFPLKTILELVNMAGEQIGVGARRKEGYGAYRIESYAG